jgi:prepilin-type N-terminal cleavage/methylation domain-containing protein
MRRAFTLIELLVIVAIIGIMVASSVVNVGAGQRIARIRASARDIFAVIRHARSTALVTQQPSVITYSTTQVDGEVCAKIEINAAKILSADAVQRATTLNGETVWLYDEGGTDNSSEGLTVEDVLFAPISTDVVRGIRIKVLKEGERLEYADNDAKSRPKISVFSNVDYLIGKLNDAKAKESAAKEQESDSSTTGNASATADSEDQAPVSVVWEVNGRTEPHKVWIFPDGSSPEKGLCIKIDRFGAAKVVSGDEGDDD